MGMDGVRGILNVNKPRGLTSAAVVDRVARLLGGAKAGHAGTLDPLASGVLIVCIGPGDPAGRVDPTAAQVVPHRDPPGRRSDTLDADGQIAYQTNPQIPSPPRRRDGRDPLDRRDRADAARLLGSEGPGPAPTTWRGPANPSIWHRDGSGSTASPWSVTTGPTWSWRSTAAAGPTSARLARDIGEALGCGGLVETLIRTRIGSFTLDRAVDLDELSTESILQHLHPSLDALTGLPRQILDPEQVARRGGGTKTRHSRLLRYGHSPGRAGADRS